MTNTQATAPIGPETPVATDPSPAVAGTPLPSDAPGPTLGPDPATHGWIQDAGFVSPTDGWALVSWELFISRDRGETWSSGYSNTTGDRTRAAAFSDAAHGWLVRERLSVDEFDTPVQVMIERTSDGGVSWESVALPPMRAAGRGSIGAHFAMLDADAGYVLVTLEYMSRGSDTHRSVLYATADGGRTWSRRTLPKGAGYWVDFVDVLDGWVSDGESLFNTSDGGLSWERQELPAPVDGPSVPLLDSGPDRTPGGTLVLFVPFSRDGDGGLIYTSDDDGVSWRLTARTPRDIGPPFLVLDGGEWLATGRSTLFATDDGGATWLVRGDVPGGLASLDVTDERDLVAIAAVGSCEDVGSTINGWVDCFIPYGLFVSNDRGATWADVTPFVP